MTPPTAKLKGVVDVLEFLAVVMGTLYHITAKKSPVFPVRLKAHDAKLPADS